jgi:hypothetical protein
VKAVEAGTATEQWMIRILSTYAPDRYNIKVSVDIFEITT